MHIQIAMLKHHPVNDRIYDENPEQDAELAESIKQNGIIRPIIVNQDMFIVSGNRRYRAAVLAGIDRVPVEKKHFKSMDEEMEFLILENMYRLKTNEEKIREGKRLEQIIIRRGDGRVRDQIGDKLGISGKSFEKGAIVQAKIQELEAEKDPRTEGLKSLLNQSIDAAYKAVKEGQYDGKPFDPKRDAEEEEEELRKAEENRKFFYLSELKQLIKTMEGTYIRLAGRRTGTTPHALGHMIGNIKEMTERLKTWFPDQMSECKVCHGSGSIESTNSIGEATMVLCGNCINGKTGTYKDSEF